MCRRLPPTASPAPQLHRVAKPARNTSREEMPVGDRSRRVILSTKISLQIKKEEPEEGRGEVESLGTGNAEPGSELSEAPVSRDRAQVCPAGPRGAPALPTPAPPHQKRGWTSLSCLGFSHTDEAPSPRYPGPQQCSERGFFLATMAPRPRAASSRQPANTHPLR